MCVCCVVLLEPGFVCLRIHKLQILPWAPTFNLLKHMMLYLNCYVRVCVWWQLKTLPVMPICKWIFQTLDMGSLVLPHRSPLFSIPWCVPVRVCVCRQLLVHQLISMLIMYRSLIAGFSTGTPYTDRGPLQHMYTVYTHTSVHVLLHRLTLDESLARQVHVHTRSPVSVGVCLSLWGLEDTKFLVTKEAEVNCRIL